MTDRMARADAEVETARDALVRKALSAGWPRIEVGVLVIVGQAAWLRALSEAHDVALAAIAGALALRIQMDEKGEDDTNPHEETTDEERSEQE